MSLTLRSDRAVVSISPDDGGRLSSLQLDGTELLGHGRPEIGSPLGWYHGLFPMAPYAGRLKDGRFRFGNLTYRVVPNSGSHAGHGLVFDVPWSTLLASDNQVALAVNLDERWPFGGTLMQSFDLDPSGLSIALQLRNDDRPMPGNLGFHPWFRRDLGTGPAVISFDPMLRYALAGDSFPRLLSHDLGQRPWDDVFTGLRQWPRIAWPEGPTISIHSTADHWIVYERQVDAFCIEPVTGPPDSLGTSRASVITPDSPLTLSMRLEWVL